MSDARRFLLPDIGNKISDVNQESPVVGPGGNSQYDLCDQHDQDSTKVVAEDDSNSTRQRRRKSKSSKRRKKSGHWTKKYSRRGSGRNSNAKLNRARGDPMRRRSAKHSLHEGSTLPPLIVPPSMRGGMPISDMESMETDEEPPHRDVPAQQGSSSSLPFLYQQQHYQSNGQVPTFLPSIRYCPQQPMSDSPPGSSSPHVLPRLDMDRFRQSPPARSLSGRLFDGTPQYYYRDYRQPSSSSIFSQEIKEMLSPSSMISEEGEESMQDHNPVTWLQSSEDRDRVGLHSDDNIDNEHNAFVKERCKIPLKRSKRRHVDRPPDD